MNLKSLVKKRKPAKRIKKIHDLRDLLDYVEKNMKPHPRLDVVKWMAKHGR